MKSVKAIRFKYNSSKELVSLFEEFRLMCNDAIRIALMEKPMSKFRPLKQGTDLFFAFRTSFRCLI